MTDEVIPATPSSKRLATALVAAGLDGLARRAQTNEFDDFHSQHPGPKLLLVEELSTTGQVNGHLAKACADIRARVIDGEFDSDKAESDAWMESPDGQETMRKLLNGE